MIVFLVSAQHTYTLDEVVGDHDGLRVDIMTYGQLLQVKTVPRATYVFTDLDRLPTELLRTAAIAYRQMRRQGVSALNDPARVLSRYGLLRALHRRGFNAFNAYRAEEGVAPSRWPVFLRSEGDHAAPMPELYADAESLGRGIAAAVDQGVPFSRLLIVEFAAAPVAPGLYRKYACFRMGGVDFGHTCVHDTQWIAKIGQTGIAPPEFYDEEVGFIRDNPFGPMVAEAFEIANIDYGRADFGLVGGKVQLYEINSNPHIEFALDHPHPARRESYRLFKQTYLDALRAIDTKPAATTAPA